MRQKSILYIACLDIFYIVILLSGIVLADCPVADLSGDCIVGLSDLFIFAESWLSDNLPQHPGLVAHWELNESEGEMASDLVGDFTGLLHGEPQWMPADGYFQGALSFDGIDDYVTIPHASALNPVDFTAAFWARVDGNLNTYRTPICSRDAAGGNYSGFNVYASNTNTWEFWTGTGSVFEKLTGPAVLDEQWTHVAISFQAVSGPDENGVCTGMKTLYINGTPAASISTGRYVPNNVEPFTLGYINHSQLWYFNGLLDDVRLYNEALSDDEILRLYQTGTVTRHSPDFTADNIVNIHDIATLTQQWLWDEPRVVISEFLASNGAGNPPDPTQGQIRDGDGDSSDWIELYNQTDTTIDLSNWGLTDKQDNPLKWQFPAGTSLEGRSFIIIFASDKHPYLDPMGYLHTNFKLSADGEYLALTRPEGTVEHAYDSALNIETMEYGFPEQDANISYGLLYNEENYFSLPTPGQPNRQSLLGIVNEPQFSHERGFYQSSFSLTLTTETPDAVIRYTTDGSDPTLSNGTTYTAPIAINTSSGYIGRHIRAAAFKPGYQSSRIITKTYLMNSTAAMRGLPAVCLSGSSTEVFYNPNGIMAIVGGTWSGGVWYALTSTDYNNVLGHGMEYERPVSMEYICFSDGEEFQEDCGIRVHGSEWMRPRYTLPPINSSWSGSNKFSLRLYFRNMYGEGKFRHSVMDKFPEVEEMDGFVLRAGHNDQTNPFVRDEMIRRLQYQMGHQVCRGTFVNLFINGIYKGYYNLCERIDEDFCQQWYNSTKEWDVVGWVVPGTISYLEARDGDTIAFNNLINLAQSSDLTNPLYYTQVEAQMDMTEFVDYIILQCWSGNWDWPQNNWSAAAERSTDRKWRFFVWDAEGGMDNTLSQNRFDKLVSADSDRSDLSKLYKALKNNEDFKILFTDRLQKHFLEVGGAMSKPKLTSLFWELAAEVQSVIPSIYTYIPDTFIPSRENIFFTQCINQGLFTFAAPRTFINGQETQKGHAAVNSQLTMQNASGVSGDIYYTLDGTDPRLPLGQRTVAVTLIPENAAKRVLVPTGDIGSEWLELSYDDSSWNDGLPVDTSKTGGAGYERETNHSTTVAPYVSYDLNSRMYGNYTSAYIRIPFTVDEEQLKDWNYLTLKMRYDDGFVAYINGVEVCRSSTVSGTPTWSSTASLHEITTGVLDTFVISNYLNTLQAGQNILTIHGLNYSKTSTDFVISAILETGCNSSGGLSPRAMKYTSAITLTKSCHVKARTLNGTQWGALRHATLSIDSSNENLRISEIMYHPNGDPNEEFVELTNTGSTELNLYNFSFNHGIQYTFSDMTLQPGQYLLLVRDANVFESRYGTGLPVTGEFEGALDNAGEKIQLSNILGEPIQIVDYEDSWYEITDGDGFSLTAVDPSYHNIVSPQTNQEARWAFNETDGPIAYDDTGQYPGTLYNIENTTRVDGHEDKALSFDGADDYVIAPYTSALNPVNFTVSFWARVDGNLNTYRAPICSRNSTGGYCSGFNIYASNANTWDFWTGGMESSFDILVGPPVLNGQWTHVAVSFHATSGPDGNGVYTGTKNLYINGVSATSTTLGRYAPNNSEPFTIGRINHSQLWYFNGLIDDVRLYSRALETDEVTALAGLCWDRKELWRPSAVRGGTPGRAETTQETLPLPDAIVINELLAHSHDGLDWIELYNTTDQNIDIGGWFLSDSFSSDVNRMKYQIPAGTILTPANPYYVVDEDNFNNPTDPGCRIPFALSEGGETVYLQSAQGEELTGYFTKESFDATQSDVSLGRFQKSYGTWNFVPMSIITKGAANAYPKVGPVIISEIMYNPGPNSGDQDYEYLELMNISSESVRTASYVHTYIGPASYIEEWIPWKFSNGITFEFPVDLWIAPGQRALLVKNRLAFDSHYTSIPTGTVIYEWTDGSLASEGETLQIAIAGDQEYLEDRYYIREDRVNYDDELPWPTQADGTGKSLTHLRPTETGNNYTNDPIHWSAEDPSPGW